MNRTATFRPEIEGLRGLAVVLVVLFHAGLPGVGGGFVGVDAFFVVSGFLITGLLVREREATGRIRISAFYARRVRRLLPAGALVLVVTLVAATRLVAPLDRPSVALDGASAALSVANVRFALAAGDYFAAVGSPSPFLHFWSLGVEEQFYLAWPAVLLVAARLAGRPRLGILVALVALSAASLAASIAITDGSPSWAFYSLPTRAWQLGLGGLAAVLAPALDRLPRAVRGTAAILGLGALLWSAVGLDEAVAYPGSIALVPALGALGIVVGGRTAPVGTLLSTTPFRWLGRISYSLYLWHWPILVLAPLALGLEPGLGLRLALAAAAIPVAVASWALVEQPFRNGLPVLAARPRRTLATGLAAIVVLATVSGGLATAGAAAAARPPVEAPELAWDDPVAPSGPDGTAGAPRTTDPRGTGTAASRLPGGSAASGPADAASPTPRPTRGPVPTSRPSPTVVAPGGSPTPPAGNALPPNLRPALVDARADEERLRADHCLAFEPGTTPNPDCVYGDRGSSTTIALVGDSHAAHWFPALEAVALHRGWRLVVFTKVSCPFIDLAVTSRVLDREYRECAAFREATIARLGALRPAAVLVAMSRWIKPVVPSTSGEESAAIGRAMARLPGRVAILVDTPYGRTDVPGCLSANPTDIGACTIRLSGGNGDLERAAARAAGAAVIDLTSSFCVRGACPAIIGDTVVYRDSHHMTATFARSLGPVLDRAFRAATGLR